MKLQLLLQTAEVIPPSSSSSSLQQGWKSSNLLLSFTLLHKTHIAAVQAETAVLPAAWSVWTTALRATWRGRWSPSWTSWPTGPGSTMATVDPLSPCPLSSTPSMVHSPPSRASWTVHTSWIPRARSRRSHAPLNGLRWRKEEAVAL